MTIITDDSILMIYGGIIAQSILAVDEFSR